MLLKNVREKNPLIHSITNYVTVNDVANILLAVGASPVMCDDEREVAQMCESSDSLYINIGTLNSDTISSMRVALARANELKIPVVFDPVGAGATQLRTKTAKEFIKEFEISLIKANLSEAKALVSNSSTTRGVDSSDEFDLKESVNLATELSDKTGAVVVITGKEDIITDGSQTFICSNGDIMLTKITGSGCMLGALMAAFVGANTSDVIASAINSTSLMGVCAQIASQWQKSLKIYGNLSFKVGLIDSVYKIEDAELQKLASVRVYS